MHEGIKAVYDKPAYFFNSVVSDEFLHVQNKLIVGHGGFSKKAIPNFSRLSFVVLSLPMVEMNPHLTSEH